MKTALLGIILSCIPLTHSSEAMNQEQSLSPREQQIAAISAHTARGDMPGLKSALSTGLDAGLTINEVKEVLVQMYAYCGFPRSLNALTAFLELTKERQKKGIKDTPGPLPSPLPASNSSSYGASNQTKLTGVPVKGELFEFAPAIDEYLKGHLFGDIFGRDNLSWKDREIATIGALAALDGVESQLNSHIKIGKHNGLTDNQVNSIIHTARPTAKNDPFPKGELAPAHFTGNAWVAMLVNNKDYDLSTYNVTFSPGARNDWHSHSVGQVLLCTKGTGYYQERGKAARKLVPGDIVEIPARTEHWHGAAPDSEFTHIGMTPKASENQTSWGSPVTDDEYATAAK